MLLKWYFIFFLALLRSLSTWCVEPIQPEMIIIPAGYFLYGTNRYIQPEMFIHPSDPKQQTIDCPTFAIGKYEVTKGEIDRFILDGGYENDRWWSKDGNKFRPHYLAYINRYYNKSQSILSSDRNLLPISGISWYEAEAYCLWLSAKLNIQFRLPTEIEWEKAARGTDGRLWPWGSDWDPDRCNWMDRNDYGVIPKGNMDGYITLAPVGSYPQGTSPYGCLDMAGNVKEWCQDWFDPIKPVHKVLRGGSYYTARPRNLRCARRCGLPPVHPFVFELDIGFRLATSDYATLSKVLESDLQD